MCIKTVEAISDLDDWPSDAVVFAARGNFGSRVWDPLIGDRFLEIIICDDCLLAGKAGVRFGQTHSEQTVRYEPWDPSSMQAEM